jgi:DNA transposition AAA+ family ATPase
VQVQNACNTAIRRNVIVVVYGAPGKGKTRCLLEYQKRNMVTAPIFILCSRNISVSYFIEKIARKLGLHTTPKIAQLEDEVSERLTRYPRSLFIDQANYLSERSLGTVCHIWEIAHTPIVLAGTKSLYDLFMTSHLTEDVRAQLSSRVAMHYPLSGLSVPESKAIIQRALGTMATNEVVAQIHNITGGIYRNLDWIISNLLELMVLNAEELKSGKVKLSELVTKAGSRLIIN